MSTSDNFVLTGFIYFILLVGKIIVFVLSVLHKTLTF